jgi:hypothetical protein
MSQNNGYLVVASKEYRYFAWAINLLEGIKDYYPEAKVCLVTEEKFLDGREDIADHIILCDDHYRAKLWGMAQSPFDKTFYLDADMTIIGEGIETVFDELGDNDMMFPPLPERFYHIFQRATFPGGKFSLCGGCCVYNSANPKVMEFMNDWYEYYVKQYSKEWWPLDEEGNFDTYNYPHDLSQWDQFTLFWLTEKEPKYADLKVEVFPNDGLKWNFWSLLAKEMEIPEDVVVYHRSFTANKEVYK